MKAPTNVYGPDGTLCRQGETIPAAWFDALPDLRDHLRIAEAAPVIDQRHDPELAKQPRARAAAIQEAAPHRNLSSSDAELIERGKLTAENEANKLANRRRPAKATVKAKAELGRKRESK